MDGTIQSTVWDFGDGTTSTAPVASHQYGAKGTFTATLTVTDDDAAVSSDSVVVTITNLNPVVQLLQTPPRAVPGVARSVYGIFYDPGPIDVVSGVVDFGDGTATVAVLSGVAISHSWSDPGTYTVTLTVDDGDGGTATMTASVLVKAASIDAGPDRAGEEGQELTFVRPLDGAQDPELAVSWDFGDGVTQGHPATSATPVKHTYEDSGTYTLTLTLYGGTLAAPITDTATITVGNVDPTVTGIATTGFPVAGIADVVQRLHVGCRRRRRTHRELGLRRRCDGDRHRGPAHLWQRWDIYGCGHCNRRRRWLIGGHVDGGDRCGRGHPLRADRQQRARLLAGVQPQLSRRRDIAHAVHHCENHYVRYGRDPRDGVRGPVLGSRPAR